MRNAFASKRSMSRIKLPHSILLRTVSHKDILVATWASTSQRSNGTLVTGKLKESKSWTSWQRVNVQFPKTFEPTCALPSMYHVPHVIRSFDSLGKATTHPQHCDFGALELRTLELNHGLGPPLSVSVIHLCWWGGRYSKMWSEIYLCQCGGGSTSSRSCRNSSKIYQMSIPILLHSCFLGCT